MTTRAIQQLGLRFPLVIRSIENAVVLGSVLPTKPLGPLPPGQLQADDDRENRDNGDVQRSR